MTRNYSKKIDVNQPDIVKELRKRGYSVELNHDDILVGYQGQTYWYEIKTGPKAKLTPSQIELLKSFNGHYKIVWTAQMIINDIKGIDQC